MNNFFEILLDRRGINNCFLFVWKIEKYNISWYCFFFYVIYNCTLVTVATAVFIK